eukprot:241276_1
MSSIRTMGSFSSTDSIVGKTVVCNDSIIFLRNRDDEEAVLEKVGGSILRRIMNMDQEDGEKEYLLGEANETIKMMSNLYETNDHNESTMLLLQQQLVDMTSKHQAAMKTIAKQEKQLQLEREGFAIVVNKLNAKLMEKKEDVYTTKDKDSEVCCSTSTTTDTTDCTLDTNTLDDDEDVFTWKERYDELLDKVHELADENEKLNQKCNQLENKNKRVPPSRSVSFDDRLVVESRIKTKYKEALMTIEQLESEIKTLHQSIDDSIGMSGCMNDMLQYFEKQLVDLDSKLKQTVVLKEETELELNEIKEQNKALKSKIAAEKEAPVTVYDDCYERGDEQEDDAHHTCHICYLLQQRLDEQKGRYARSKSCLM